MPNIGEIFKKARLDSGLSLKEAAKLSGLTDSKILRIENGVIKEPSPTSVKKLCVLYHIPDLGSKTRLKHGQVTRK
jgi:transcriptional regulator with XRE-family HTH domain